MKLGSIELKVAVPVVATALAGTLGTAVYKVVLSFGWFHPTTAQSLALVGVGAAALPVIVAVTGYATPHTPRSDLADPPGVLADPAGAVPGVSAPDAITPQPLADSSPAPQPPADAYPDTPPETGGSVAVPFAQQEAS